MVDVYGDDFLRTPLFYSAYDYLPVRYCAARSQKAWRYEGVRFSIQETLFGLAHGSGWNLLRSRLPDHRLDGPGVGALYLSDEQANYFY